MWRQKLKAGALQLTVYIMIVIALILMGFILLVHTHKQFGLQSQLTIETVQNTTKGIQYCLREATQLRDTTTINLNDEDYKSLKIYRNYWGIFEKVTTVSKIKTQRFKNVALLGSLQPAANRTALYVADNNKPLVVVGNTKIEGLSYIPKQGIKPGTIAGQFYNGSQLIYGKQRVSSRLPKLDVEIQSELNTIANQYAQLKTEQFINLQDGQSYGNSFLEPVQVVFSNQSIDLQNVRLTGHIIIQSKTKITVYPSSQLTDVLLIAPKIELKTNTKGKFQAIATEHIYIEKQVTLEYPSALVLNEKKEDIRNQDSNLPKEEAKLDIDENTVIQGVVLFSGQVNPNNYQVQVELKNNATIIGELYCNQNTELKGTVYGSVYTDNFIAKQAGSIYQNHIFNGTIHSEARHENYVGLGFENSEKGILKWLY